MMDISSETMLPALIGLYLVLLLAHALLRLKGRKSLFLVDAFLLGQMLYTFGAIFVWVEGVEYSAKLLLIALLAGISGLAGALFSARLWKGNVSLGPDALSIFEIRLVDIGLVVCSLVSAVFLVAVYANDELRFVFHEVLAGVPGALNALRLDISSGVHGYFAPGYVKQFRDIGAPVLCAALVLKGELKSRLPLFLLTLVLCCAAIYVSGQRLVILQFMICLSLAGFIAYRRDRDLKSVSILGAAVVILIAFMGLMTVQLGRTNIALSPAKVQQAPVAQVQPSKPSEQNGFLSGLFSTKLSETNIPAPVVVAIALAHRSVIAVPRENTMTIELWEKGGDYPGAGWVNDLASIRPGTQRQISNELSSMQGSSDLGNSPLGLPADLFFNWGYPGAVLFPFLFALLWTAWDAVLQRSPYAVVRASRLFLFFSIPLMYSPFMFVLYGGVIVLAIWLGMLTLGALSQRLLPSGKVER